MNTPQPHKRAHARRRNLTALSMLALTPLVLTACGEAVATKEKAEATHDVTITNCGRELQFDAVPSAVVGLMPSQTELLLRLGVRENLVGQAQVETSALPDDIAGQATDIPVLSTNMPPVREDLLAVSPDFVVSPTEYEFTAEQGYASIQQLSDNGAQAYVATGGCADRRSTAEVADVFTDITNLGEILNASNEAGKLVQDAQARLDAVRTAIAGEKQPTVAQIYVDGKTIGAIGAGVEADIIRQAGGENVFDPNAPEFAAFFAAEINPEEIIARNPDAIIFGVSSPEQEQQIRDYVTKTFPKVAAVKDNKLIAVPQSDLYPGTLGNVEAVELIAQQLYPTAF
ncbi:ABC transporter substrate-binding protein [Timonella sp. A28]|uniref:ABC transporter substrate-binding protein n=1 Tax=Timonella sp. A28 TaxID=3442640 RepID=UPI003EB73C54